jgi:hypothetical protein
MKKVSLFIALLICAADLTLFSQNAGNTVTITAGTPHSAVLRPNDSHRYRVTVRDKAYLLAYTESDIDTVMTLFDAAGTELASDDDSGTGSNASIRRIVSAGTYTIEVSGYDDAAGRYILHVEAPRVSVVSPVNQRLVGRWVGVDGVLWVFNADGSGTRDKGNIMHSFFQDKIIMFLPDGSPEVSLYDYNYSADGGTLFLINPASAIWLMKLD